MSKRASRRLIRNADALGERVRATGMTGGIPYGDLNRDGLVRAIPEFGAFEDSVRQSSRLRSLYGQEVTRIALSWAYTAAESTDPVETAWERFWDSAIEPVWRYASVANLTSFVAELKSAPINDFVEILPRSGRDLTERLGWTEQTLQQTIGEDWLRTGSASEFVIVATSAIEKRPDNVVLSGPGTGELAIADALTALRLAGAGDVGIGSVFTTRIGGPPVLLLGLSVSPSLLALRFGSTYELDETRLKSVRALAKRLDTFRAGSSSYPELMSALDRSRAAYDRPSGALADRVVDDIIALESVAVVNDELSFRIAVRLSGLLADSDSDRLALFRLIRDFYGVRSTIVHGGRLKAGAQALLTREPDLREVVRLTIRALLNLTESGTMRPDRRFLSDTIDDYVLDAGRRVGLRVATSVPGWQPPITAQPTSNSRTTRLWTDAAVGRLTDGP